MATVLETIKKKLALEDVIPIWAARLKEEGGLWRFISSITVLSINAKYYHRYSSHKACLLGEFHGGRDEYSIASNPEYCDVCYELAAIGTYGLKRGISFEPENESVNAERFDSMWEKDFLTHVQESHPDKVRR